jgi:hypothetical protein
MVAQPIACCGEIGRILRQHSMAERGMRSPVIMVEDPGADLFPRVGEAEEQRFVQKLVTHASIEAFAKAVLNRLARGDVMPLDLAFVRPEKDGVLGSGLNYFKSSKPR